MSPKPWEVTDDDLAQGLGPASSTKGDELDDPDGYGLVDSDDDLEELDDPWSSDQPAAMPAVTPARPIEPQAESPNVAPAAAEPEPAGEPEPAAEPTTVDDTDPDEDLSGEISPEPSHESVSSAPTSDAFAPAPPAQGAAAVDDADDFDDFWDEPVTPDDRAPAAAGYDLSAFPGGVADPAPRAERTPGVGGAAAEQVGGGDDPDDEDPDGTLTVTLRRNREPQQPSPARSYRTSSEARRPVKPSERRHKMDVAPIKQGPMARMRKMLTGDADVSRAHETSAKRDTIRPLNVVVLGKKGGVGKTVVTTLLGHTFASVRKDRVLAVDASPTGGNLSARCPKEGLGTVVSLLDQLEYVTAYANVREHTAKGDTGLEVLGADVTRPQRPITGPDYRRLMDELRRHYQLILSDTPGDITTASADGPEGIVPALLDEADLLVLVAEGVDGANAATWLVNWLKARLRDTDDRHLEKLLDDLIVVVSSRSPKSNAKPDRMARYFSEEIARRVVLLPFDPVVEGGLEIDYNLISPKTRKAMLELADAVTGSDAFTGR